MVVFKIIILLVVAVTMICMLVSPILETLNVTSEKSVRIAKGLSLSGTTYVLTVPVRLYLRLNFMLERSIPKAFQLMATKSIDGHHKVKLQIRKTTLYIKPSWYPSGAIPLGQIRTDKLNTLSVRISEPNLIVKLNNNLTKVRLTFSTFAGSSVTFGRSQQTYIGPMCTITSFFIRNKLQDLTKAKKVEKLLGKSP